MARLNADGHIVLSYEYEGFKHHWDDLSKYIIGKHGEQEFTDHVDVQEILSDCINYLAEKMKDLLNTEKTLSFFIYVFWLHEESHRLNLKFRSGMEFNELTSSELAAYRRILKLILENGCDIPMEQGLFPTEEEVTRMDTKLQELIYLGKWLYWFADHDAIHKMVADSKLIRFDGAHKLEVDWQFHFGAVYENLLSLVKEDYENAMFDEQAMKELISSLEKCFKIKFGDAIWLVNELKRKHSKGDSQFATFEYDLLPKNLKTIADISSAYAESFFGGLAISKSNKQSLVQSVRKPYQMERHLFRPVLVYQVNGIAKALVSENKLQESIWVIATNAIHWSAMPIEWKKNPCMLKFMQEKAAAHDKLLEDQIQVVIDAGGYLFCRNETKLKDENGNTVDFEEACGEIDFIIVNQKTGFVFVTDAKYNRARYDAVGFRNEYSTFKDEYEPKLRKKLDWIRQHKDLLASHLKHKHGLANLDLTNFTFEAAFLINTPTFYMFNGNFKAIPLNQVDLYFAGNFGYPVFMIDKPDGSQQIAQHPYFVKPIEINF